MDPGTIQAIAAVAQVILAGALIWVTKQYVDLTRGINNSSKDSADATQLAARAVQQSADATKQSVEQMKDDHRPILVPRCNPKSTEKALIAVWNARLLGADAQYLRLVNLGPGAALNGRIKLRIGYPNDSAKSAKDEVHGYVTEDRTTADPVGPGDGVLVYNYNAGNPTSIPDWSWLSIYYDDVYNRHYITQSQWNGTDWLKIETRQTDEKHLYFNPELPPALRTTL